MSLNLTTSISKVLDQVRGIVSKDGTTLEVFEYNTATGTTSVGTITQGWMAYRQDYRGEADGRFLEVLVTDSSSGLAEMFRQPTHLKMGSLYYKIRGIEPPADVNDMVRYWLIRCDHTGKSSA